LKRDIDLEVPINIGGIRPHFFDLATAERDAVAECKAFAFTATGSNPAAKISTLREAAGYLTSVPGSVMRLLIVKEDPHPKRGETLGRYFARLNAHHLRQVTVLEMHEAGGVLGVFGRRIAQPHPLYETSSEHSNTYCVSSVVAEHLFLAILCLPLISKPPVWVIRCAVPG
jgi:hypothetical protein